MTVPLTPNDPPPPVPPGPDDGTEDHTVARDLRDGLIVAVLVTVCGLVLGGLWLWFAPRVPLISDGSAIYLKDSEGEQAIGADGWFTLLGLGMGVLTAAGVYLWRRTGGIVLVVALAVGGVLASILAWRLGVHLGPTSNVIAHAKQVGVNKVFDGPLQLHAKGALLAWPVASMAVYLGLTSLFTPEDAPRPVAQWPGWDPRDAQPPQPPAAPQGSDEAAEPPADERDADGGSDGPHRSGGERP